MPKDADKFILRMPDGMRRQIKKAALENRRTMTAEIVYHLSKVFPESERNAATQR